jgi:hypothetical protein
VVMCRWKASAMAERNTSAQKSIKIKRPKRRVHTPLKTGTVVHKPKKTYTRKERYKRRWQNVEEEDLE